MNKSALDPRQRQGVTALLRALISGYVDSYALLNFGVYASFMTGNTTSGGLHAAQGNLPAAAHRLLPIPFFAFGVLAGSLLKQLKHPALPRLSVLVALLLLVVVAATWLAWPSWFYIMILSFAMGALNTSVTQVGGQSVSLGYITGDLNNLAQHVARGLTRAPVEQPQGPHDTHWARAWLLASLWMAFFAGALAGGFAALRFNLWTLLLPAMLLLVLAAGEPPSLADHDPKP